jgi:energy-coupling factor transporter ATP-binding protein EcfA2
VNAGGDGFERPNPFSTRFVRPGAIGYRFEDGQTAAGLVARLAELGWRAQVLGPHGSGKSTLIAAIVGPLEQGGRGACVFVLRDGQRRMPVGWVSDANKASAGVIVVDGYEQLGRLNRCWLALRCRRNGWGLLVTAHRDVGFRTLYRTAANLDVAQAVVAALLPADDTSISRQTVADAFAASQGDLRETLFALYDRYEVSRPRK